MAERAVILGIDPGVAGGIAFYDPSLDPANMRAATVFDMPITRAARGKAAMDVDTLGLMERINAVTDMGLRISKACIEQVQSRPRQAGQFQFGVNLGRILGALEAAQIPIQHISSSKWKQSLGLRGEDKSMSVKLAAELFPNLKHELYGPRGAGLDGRAEALLISFYGSQHP